MKTVNGAAAAAKTRKFEFWTYDVWGNARDGFDVNDRFRRGTIEIKCAAEVHNAGKPCEFTTFNPTDRQLSRAVGGRGLEWETSDGANYYASLKTNGKPVCELIEIDG